MTEQEIKAVFRQALAAKRALDAANEALSYMREAARSANAPPLSDLPRTGAGGRSYEKLEAAIDRYEQALAVYSDLCDRAAALLALAPEGDGKTIIVRHWINGDSWNEIALSLHISRKSMFRYYAAAVREIAEKEKLTPIDT